MEKEEAGVIIVCALIALLGVAFLCGHDGLVFASITAIIGAICGALFGFSVQVNK